MAWVYSAYKSAKEMEYSDRLWLLHSSIAARTPQTKKSAKAMEKHVKSMYKIAESQVPWRRKVTQASNNKEQYIKERVSKPINPRVYVEDGDNLPHEIRSFVNSVQKVGTETENK